MSPLDQRVEEKIGVSMSLQQNVLNLPAGWLALLFTKGRVSSLDGKTIVCTGYSVLPGNRRYTASYFVKNSLLLREGEYVNLLLHSSKFQMKRERLTNVRGKPIIS